MENIRSQSRLKRLVYAAPGVLCALTFLALGAADLMRPQALLSEMARLGYPPYLLTILGVAKILGTCAIAVLPSRSRLVEWAYAGMTFDLLGAAASHAASGDAVTQTVAPLGLVVLVAMSWAMRAQIRDDLRHSALALADRPLFKRLWQAPVQAVLARLDNNRFGVTDSLHPLRPHGSTTTKVAPGPYFIAGAPTRRDLREDREGVKLALRLRVIDRATQLPVDGALVELWQCDARGIYSGFVARGPEFPNAVRLLLDPVPTDDARFLRGAFRTDLQGDVEFTTIVPGWYPPRTPHIHLSIDSRPAAAFVTQLFFPQQLVAEVQSQPPYNVRPPGMVTNEHDVEIYRSRGAPGCWPNFIRTADGFIGELTLSIDGDSRVAVPST